jgi:hypothetical protein
MEFLMLSVFTRSASASKNDAPAAAAGLPRVIHNEASGGISRFAKMTQAFSFISNAYQQCDLSGVL